MYPKININSSLALSTFGLIVAAAVVAGILIAVFEFKRRKIDLNLLPGGFFWAFIFGVIGNRVFHIIFFSWYKFIEDPLGVLFSTSGWMYYGIEVFGLTACAVYAWRNRINVLGVLDMMALILMISHGIGRMACFFAGCCHGVTTDSFLGVTFPGTNTPVYPTQLFEAVPLLILFAFGWYYRSRFKRNGLLFSMYIITYGLLRFSIEFLRADGFSANTLLSPSQIIALCFIALGIFLSYKIMSPRSALT